VQVPVDSIVTTPVELTEHTPGVVDVYTGVTPEVVVAPIGNVPPEIYAVELGTVPGTVIVSAAAVIGNVFVTEVAAA
jgi:hypothetical protein